MLLSKNKIEIRDIRISDILDQYLDYLEKMQQMDLEIASEFVQMAAHLLYIKTRMLLCIRYIDDIVFIQIRRRNPHQRQNRILLLRRKIRP